MFKHLVYGRFECVYVHLVELLKKKSTTKLGSHWTECIELTSRNETKIERKQRCGKTRANLSLVVSVMTLQQCKPMRSLHEFIRVWTRKWSSEVCMFAGIEIRINFGGWTVAATKTAFIYRNITWFFAFHTFTDSQYFEFASSFGHSVDQNVEFDVEKCLFWFDFIRRMSIAFQFTSKFRFIFSHFFLLFYSLLDRSHLISTNWRSLISTRNNFSNRQQEKLFTTRNAHFHCLSVCCNSELNWISLLLFESNVTGKVVVHSVWPHRPEK